MTDFDTCKAEYLRRDGVSCLYCGSNDIESLGSIQVDEGYAWQEIQCNKCEKCWRDVYDLADVEEMEKN